jgi:hypothetical protein
MLDWKAAQLHTFKLSLLGKKFIKLSYDSLFLDITCILTLHCRPNHSMYSNGAHLSLLCSRWGPLSMSLYFNVPNINVLPTHQQNPTSTRKSWCLEQSSAFKCFADQLLYMYINLALKYRVVLKGGGRYPLYRCKPLFKNKWRHLCYSSLQLYATQKSHLPINLVYFFFLLILTIVVTVWTKYRLKKN